MQDDLAGLGDQQGIRDGGGDGAHDMNHDGSGRLAARMRARLRGAAGNDDGLTTAEYAVGTVAAAGLGGVLLKLLTSSEVRDLIWKVVSGAFQALMG